MQISVVVCTRNRAGALPRLFTALERQTLTGRVPWELIFIDNGSTDDTARVVRQFATHAGFPVICEFERRPGKSYGLNTGIALARGSIIALTDDDGIPAPDWLENIHRYFAAYPAIACLGGRVELYNPADALVTVRTSRTAGVVDASNFSAINIPVIGCNMAIRAGVLRQVGPYDVDIGPGSRIGVAEDVDMLFRLVRSGGKIGYDPQLVVLHNHGRRDANEIERLQRGYVLGRGAFYCKHLLRADRMAAREAYWEVRGLILEWLKEGLLTKPARQALRFLVLLATGAARYLRYRRPGRALQT